MHFKKDADKLENIQKKGIKVRKGKMYKEQLETRYWYLAGEEKIPQRHDRCFQVSEDL